VRWDFPYPAIRVSVHVVDDGSPVPARAEIEGLEFGRPFELHLTEQPNSGVAAARNTGLRQVGEATTYIAFLDSDDLWPRDHLGSAVAALDRGFDLYFCNSQRDGSPQARFTEFAFGDFLTKHAKPLPGGLYELDCKPFTEPIVRCGIDGVNIFAGKFSWNDPGHLIRHMGQLLACYRFREELSLSSENRRTLAAKINKVRAAFAFFTVRYFLKKREAWLQELRRLVQSDRGFLAWYPFYIVYVAACFLLRLYDPLK
jgi:glycosyltransferase involved in cell wall biosynthesis